MLIRIILFNCRRSIARPPCMALTWPSTEVPAPKGNHWNVMASADLHNCADFARVFREANDIRQCGFVIRLAMAVMLTLTRGVRNPRSEKKVEICQSGFQRLHV